MKKTFALFLLLYFFIPQSIHAAYPTCTATADCPAGEYCYNTGRGKECTTKLSNGDACSSAEPCQSNNCVDGKCAAITPPPPTPAGGGTDSGAAPTSGQYDLPNFLGTEEPADVIGRIIKTVIGFCGVLALIMFIYGGVMWLISAGREAYIDKGKDTMVWSAIGLAVVFGSYILVNFVFTFFGK